MSNLFTNICNSPAFDSYSTIDATASHASGAFFSPHTLREGFHFTPNGYQRAAYSPELTKDSEYDFDEDVALSQTSVMAVTPARVMAPPQWMPSAPVVPPPAPVVHQRPMTSHNPIDDDTLFL